jgi:hypothetical protein
MKPKVAVATVKKQPSARPRWASENGVLFPQALRDAIPGPDLPGCDRLLVLSSIDAGYVDSILYGRRVELNLRVEESGKLKGAFDLKVHLNLDAARGLAATLQRLLDQDQRPRG